MRLWIDIGNAFACIVGGEVISHYYFPYDSNDAECKELFEALDCKLEEMNSGWKLCCYDVGDDELQILNKFSGGEYGFDVSIMEDIEKDTLRGFLSCNSCLKRTFTMNDIHLRTISCICK